MIISTVTNEVRKKKPGWFIYGSFVSARVSANGRAFRPDSKEPRCVNGLRRRRLECFLRSWEVLGGGLSGRPHADDGCVSSPPAQVSRGDFSGERTHLPIGVPSSARPRGARHERVNTVDLVYRRSEERRRGAWYNAVDTPVTFSSLSAAAVVCPQVKH